MAKCNQLTPLPFKGLSMRLLSLTSQVCAVNCTGGIVISTVPSSVIEFHCLHCKLATLDKCLLN